MKIVKNMHDSPRTAPSLGRLKAYEEREVEDSVADMVVRNRNFSIVTKGEKEEQPEQPDATEPEDIGEEENENQSED